MAFYASVSEALQATRDRLQEIAGPQNNPENLGKLTGFLDYSFTPENRRGVNARMLENASNSDYRPVEITYYEREIGDGIIEDDSLLDCDPGTQKQKKIEVVQPSLFVYDEVTIEEKYMREVIEEGNIDDMIQYHIQPKMRTLRERVNQKLFAKAGASMGANPAPSAGGTGLGEPGEAGNYQPITLLNADGTINDESFDDIKIQMEDNYLMGEFAAVGLGKLRKYHNRLNISEINNFGVDYRDLLSQNGYGYVKDHTTTAALGGADRFLIIAPGFVHPYFYNLNRGDYNFEIDNKEGKGLMQDPRYPIQWDMDYAYFRCAGDTTLQGKYLIRLWSYFDLFVVPTEVFKAGDELAGMNGIFGFNAVQSA